jgi:hypothetical protein
MTEPTKTAPDAQPLVGASEAAEMMGVELSTFSHLRRREAATENSKFPLPIAILRCGPIWKTNEIKRFAAKYTAPRPGPKPGAETKQRKPGRAVKQTLTKSPADAAVAGNGHSKAPAKKVAAKKAPAKAVAVPAKPLKRAPRKAVPVAV